MLSPPRTDPAPPASPDPWRPAQLTRPDLWPRRPAQPAQPVLARHFRNVGRDKPGGGVRGEGFRFSPAPDIARTKQTNGRA